MQILLYGWIPVMLFFLVRALSASHPHSCSFASLTSVLWLLNPQFLLGALQVLDTMMITMLLLATALSYARLKSEATGTRAAASGLLTGVWYLLRPTGFVTFLLMLLGQISMYRASVHKRYIVITFICLCLPPGLWIGIRYLSGGQTHFGYTSTGYNLWLGNNPDTLPFLERTWGDAATIEDALLAVNSEQLADIAGKDEVTKNRLLTHRAIEYTMAHPYTFIKRAIWKVVGFWSPFRNREGHYSASWKKEAVVLLYQFPLILLALYTLIRALVFPEWRKGKHIGTVILFIVVWMLPYLLFFATPRFRQPVDPLLLYLAVLGLQPSIATRIKRLLGV
ncbi:MAG: hypothetical protein JXA28_04240 [Bacteroidetes bacterium]|nr:hypothetical protein [Bacteroidota bacterium]